MMAVSAHLISLNMAGTDLELHVWLDGTDMALGEGQMSSRSYEGLNADCQIKRVNICASSSDRHRHGRCNPDCDTPKFGIGLVCERQVGLIEGLHGSNVFPIAVVQVRLHMHANVLRAGDHFAAKVVGLQHSGKLGQW